MTETASVMPMVLWALAAVLVVVGFAGTILPAMPGIPLIYGGLFLAAYIDNFQRVGWPTLLILAAMGLFAIGVDLAAGYFGAKKAGASKLALLGAALGTIFGLFAGIIGVFIFPFVGAFLGEYVSRTLDAKKLEVGVQNSQSQQALGAAKVGIATWLGLVVGAVTKVAVGLMMLGVFALAYFVK
jgi:uncharacterized protein